MNSRRKTLAWSLMIACAAAANAASAQTQPEAPRSSIAQQDFFAAPVPLDELPPPLRERVRSVIEHPTLSSRGPLEAFRCRPELYYWLLDHPDLAMRLWRGLGAKCMDIHERGDGSFAWKDPQNGEMHWQTIVRTGKQRVWYAEGRVKPGLMFPSVSVRAVVVLNHQEGSDGKGKPAVRHQMDMVLHTDSRAVSLAARLFGASAPRLAEEYVSQLEMFFGALAWYLTEHPDKAAALFQELKVSPGRS
ncbi:MAG TPA: hypothetical protein VMF69_17940 [Gemmataceae bacterium]|nr:hypothetical protein [Gemmataceae bacterium]